MIKIITNKRRNEEAISIQTVANFRDFLVNETKKAWKFITESNVYDSSQKSKRNTIKIMYAQIVRDEQIMCKLKYAQQLFNLGKSLDIESQSIYPEIFKLGLLKDRRTKLMSIPQVNKQSKSKQALSNKFIMKEIVALTKEIDKCQYKIDEFNKKITLTPTDLGEDFANRLLDMVA